MALQVHPGVLIGAEARYVRSYEGLAPRYLHRKCALPRPHILCAAFGTYWVSAGWNAQGAGHAVNAQGSLDVTNYERYQAKLRFGYNF